MPVRVGINGFGRMGRLALRAAWEWPELEFSHINETKGGPEAAAHLLKFDSVHGRWGPEVAAEGGRVRIDDRRLSFSAHPSPGTCPGPTWESTWSWSARASSAPPSSWPRTSAAACARSSWPLP